MATRATTATKQAKRRSRTRKPQGLTIPTTFATPGVHPFDEVAWEKRDIVQQNWKTGETVFEQLGVEVPAHWSVNATTIAATKYFRGALGTPARETSIKQLISRVVNTYTAAGAKNGYFATKADEQNFSRDLTWALLHQHVSFNSPVWFNVGTNSAPQISACFILSVDDSMDSILDWYKEEGRIFKGGSGAGVNLSAIRSSRELLSSGGTASGPVSFMRGADASAGTIKSGGATRRAAKMVVLDVDHPDIEEFVETKALEEDKIRALRDAGFDMDLGGKDITSVQYQNANNSVRVDDEFMRAVEAGGLYDLKARTTDQTWPVDARELFRKIAEAAWACADPGIQYKDTINGWHTTPASGPITASNPCSEYMSVDNSSCNLASINLMKFLREDGTFDVERFVALSKLMITAMDISICFGAFPTEKIAENTRSFRQLGLGYANLGALLMATGHGYDSDGGRDLAGAITSLMAAASHAQSLEIARVKGGYDHWEANAASHAAVVKRHAEASLVADADPQGDSGAILSAATGIWEQVVAAIESGDALRNAQLTLLAPTGTIGFLMDCDTTGIEPDFSLVKFKKLVGGGSMQIVNQTVTLALSRLGYDETQAAEIVAYVAEHGNVVGAPHLGQAHYEVFDCAVGERAISPMGHVRMMAAVQPFLSGAISKTVNMPETATVEEIENIYMQGWKLGLKALAIYRDNCKVGQPLSVKKSEKKGDAKPVDDEVWEKIVEKVVYRPTRERLPKRRTSRTTSFTVGGAEGYLTTGEYEDGRLGEMFLKFGKQGSTMAGVMDAFSIAISVALQYGVPLESLVQKYTNMRFEPAGMTDDPEVRMSQSLMDYVFKRLALDYLPFEDRSALGIYTSEERARYVETGSYELTEEEQAAMQEDWVRTDPKTAAPKPVVVRPEPSNPEFDEVAPASEQPVSGVHSTAELADRMNHASADAPLCMTCGTKMQRAGSCHVCEGCGSTSGCS